MLASLPSTLAAAAESGNVGRLKQALATFQASNPGVGGSVPTAATFTDKDGRTMLHYACRKGVPDVAKFLIDSRVRAGCSPFHRHCRAA